jgi:hypothetical protein
VHSGCLLRPALCGIMWSKDVPLFHPSQSPPTQATKDSVHWQPYREMDLYGVHQEVTQAAESVISGCRVCQYYHLFPAGIASYEALLKYLVCLVLIVTIFLG